MDPANENRIWICYTGYFEETKVFYSENAGNSWTNYDIDNDLPNLPINCITYQKGTDDIIYVGTDVGVFVKEGIYGNWEKYGDFPNVRVEEMKINYCAKKLRVATFGRGIWEGDILPFNKELPTITIKNGKNIVWDTDVRRSLSSNLKIETGGKLTLKGEISLLKDSKIIVKPGGELIISGGKLTNSCGEQWQGIVVEGNPNLPQYPNENQGVVKILNGATIENAHTAVHSQNGGVVIAKNSNFTNNFTDIQIEDYSYGSINRSKIRNCNFVTTNHFYNYHFNLSSHVYLSNTNKKTPNHLNLGADRIIVFKKIA